MLQEEFNEAYVEGIRPSRRDGRAPVFPKERAGSGRNTGAALAAHPDSTSVHTEITFYRWRGPGDEEGDCLIDETRREQDESG
jgi:hypothetical protein